MMESSRATVRSASGESFHVDVNMVQKNYDQERICGDNFQSKRVREENRIIAVLSDGMGHGVKASLLSTLTSTMALNFTAEHKEVHRTAEIIMRTLPVCSDRQISYATFTIVDIDIDGNTHILEYDNPTALIMRGNRFITPEWQKITLSSEKNKNKEIFSCHFKHRKEDRIILFSDGVPQSGMGSNKYPFGWGMENAQMFVQSLISHEPTISAHQLAMKVVNMANQNDDFHPKDDTTCAVIYFREPRKTLVSTGPPYEKINDIKLVRKVVEFEGRKIICGATTADIVARETGKTITDSFEFDDPDLPPIAFMDGIDLITEGILTLGKVADILRVFSPKYNMGKGPADKIVKILLDSDEINFIIGTRINIAHQDPNLPVALEIRRTVVKRIARLLEEKFLKEVHISFI